MKCFQLFNSQNDKQPQVIKKKFGNNRIQKMNYYRQQRLICNETFLKKMLAHVFHVVYSHWPSIFQEHIFTHRVICSFLLLLNFGHKCEILMLNGVSWWLVDPNLKTISYYFLIFSQQNRKIIVFVPELCNGVQCA